MFYGVLGFWGLAARHKNLKYQDVKMRKKQIANKKNRKCRMSLAFWLQNKKKN